MSSPKWFKKLSALGKLATVVAAIGGGVTVCYGGYTWLRHQSETQEWARKQKENAEKAGVVDVYARQNDTRNSVDALKKDITEIKVTAARIEGKVDVMLRERERRRGEVAANPVPSGTER